MKNADADNETIFQKTGFPLKPASHLELTAQVPETLNQFNRCLFSKKTLKNASVLHQK